jgi:hypothetical protein
MKDSLQIHISVKRGDQTKAWGAVIPDSGLNRTALRKIMLDVGKLIMQWTKTSLGTVS